MNLQNIKYLLILILTISFGCQEKQKLDGYYSNCNNGYYSEIYFKKDSMRVASENDRIKLSEWRKINIKNDTLFFEMFGEWKIPSKAKIKYIGREKIELIFLTNTQNSDLKRVQIFERIDDNFEFNPSKEFWTKFKKRKNSADCKIKAKKTMANTL